MNDPNIIARLSMKDHIKFRKLYFEAHMSDMINNDGIFDINSPEWVAFKKCYVEFGYEYHFPITGTKIDRDGYIIKEEAMFDV